MDARPSALSAFDDLARSLAGRIPAVFLDYDGTLTPIVDRPDLARLDDRTRASLVALAARCPLAIVSGRDLDDVRVLVGLDDLVYAGSHGFDIQGPSLRTSVGEEYRPSLARAADALDARLSPIPGLLVERKRFAVAVHTRRVAQDAKPAIAAAVRELAARHPDLRVTGGKEIVELRPNLPWDKGRAVLSLLDRLGLEASGHVPLYIGDDETDEDAFRALAGRGIGIRVADPPGDTAAAWLLREPAEVAAFLEALAAFLDRPRSQA